MARQCRHAMVFSGHARRRGRGRLDALLAPAFGLLIFASVAHGRAVAPDVPENSPTVTRLSNRVLILDSLDVNVTAISAESGLVVIDTNRSPAAMRHLRDVIEAQFGRRKFIYLINTHGDPDHSFGNPALPTVPLIAQQDYGAYVLHAKAPTLRQEWARKSRLDLHNDETVRMPAITFRDSLDLDLGDLTLELRFCGDAHTNHDIVVYVPEEKLLLSGDLICSPQSPCFAINAMADVPRLVRELERLLHREEGLETIVPGHGKPLTRAELSGFCRSISERYGEVQSDRSAARILGQAIERDGIEAALEQCLPPVPGRPGAIYWSEEELATLGGRLVRRGRVDEAVRVLQLAVRALPGSALLYGCLGDACVESDDREGAEYAYAKSLALSPENRYAAEMLEAIRDSE